MSPDQSYTSLNKSSKNGHKMLFVVERRESFICVSAVTSPSEGGESDEVAKHNGQVGRRRRKEEKTPSLDVLHNPQTNEIGISNGSRGCGSGFLYKSQGLL